MAFPLLKGCLFEGVKVKNNKVGGIENATTLNQIALHVSFFFLISFFMNLFILNFFFYLDSALILKLRIRGSWSRFSILKACNWTSFLMLSFLYQQF